MAATRTHAVSPEGRLEDRPLLTGGGRFVADVTRPGQQWLAVVRSPLAHGRIARIDASDALRSPGVRAVLSARDWEGPIPTIPIRVLPQPAMQQRLQPVIADGRVRYVGEPVAVVVADDPYRAEDAAELVAVEFEHLPPVTTVDDESTDLWDHVPGNELCRFDGTSGDVEGAFADAAVVVRTRLSTGRHTGLPLETRGLVAEWDGDLLHLWGVTKYIHFTRRTVAGFFALDPDRVVCHRIDVGGMFGSRGEVYPEDFLVPWAAQVTGAPVGWVEDRREHLLAINHSRQQRHDFELAVAADGTFLAFRDAAAVDMGAYPRPIGARMVQLVLESLPGPYRWAAFAASCRGVATNKTPVGTMRGPSTYETTFVRERAIDIAAGRLGVDPLELRMRNLIPRADLPLHVAVEGDVTHVHYDAGDYEAVVRATLAACGYDAMNAEVARRRAAGESVGIGVAFFADHSGVGKEESVGLRLAEDGRFVLGTSTTEIGQGLATMATTVLTDLLGVPAEGVTVDLGSSAAHPDGNGTFASRTTIFVSNAAKDAAEQILERTASAAAERWRTTVGEVQREPDGVRWGDEHLHYKELAPVEVVGRYRMEEPMVGFGLLLALVGVDPGTGAVRVERLGVGYDVGRAIDRASVEQQLIGASVQGLGGALLEELPYDEDGQPLATTFMDYLLPTAAEAPVVQAVVCETQPAPDNPMGVRGAGEAGIVAAGAVIANGVAAAVGARGTVLTRLPLKPEDIRAATTSPED